MPTASTIMPGPETLAHYLHRHAERTSGKVVFTFLADGEEVESTLTFGELRDRAQAIAWTLVSAGLGGKPVVLLHPPGREFIIAFCGCLMAGAVAVPLQPPVTRRLLDRAQAVLADCGAAAVLAMTGSTGVAELADSRGLPLITTDGIRVADGDAPPAVAINADTPAVLQYTSGSTGTPKGVIITQGNLVANSWLIADAFADRPDDIMVNWLPLLHDMGLVGHVVHIIHLGSTCVHLQPQSMIRKPIRWLRALARFGATISGGPDFAWRLIAERVTPGDLAGLDLSRWRVAFSGAEPVRASTLRRVADLLRPTGFSEGAFLPCYGMAEATLIISGGPNGRPLTVARPEGAAADSAGYVGCGRPVPTGSVAVVDPETGIRRPDGQVGEVWATGPHVAAGYWGREAATRQTFHARLADDPRAWLRTGDLGFLHAGQLHISGRIKDLLIINGRKHHAEDLEATVQGEVPECASGAAAVFQAEADGQTRLIIVVEMADRPADETAHKRLTAAVCAAVWQHHELVVGSVAVVRPGRLPRTTSGKVRRAETRELWSTGQLAASAAPLAGSG